MFKYEKRIAFHETDAMGVVHHSNYIRLFEEARVAWLRAKGLTSIHAPSGPYTFAVVSLNARYLKPARFEDLVEVHVAARLNGIRIEFRYAVWSERVGEWLVIGETELVPLDGDLKILRLPKETVEAFREEAWREEDPWPPAAQETAPASCRPS